MNFVDSLRSFAHEISFAFQAGIVIGAFLALVFHFVRARREARRSQIRWEERIGHDARHRRAA